MSDGQRDGRPSIDFTAIRTAHPLHDVIASYGIALRRSGNEYIGLCPFHADGEPSLTVFRARDGAPRYHCFACGEHGDVVDFVRAAEHCTHAEALRKLDGGASDRPRLQPPERDPAQDWHPADPATAPVLRCAPGDRLTVFNPKRGRESTLRPTHLWPYVDASGVTIAYVARCLIEGRKWTPTITWAAGPGGPTGPGGVPDATWALVRPARPYPALGITDLQARPDARVLIVSGERCRDVAADLFPDRVVLTWMGGDQAIEHTDWSGLAGRQVTFWPDADPSGRNAGERLCALLAPTAAAVRLIATTGDSGDDVCDYVERDGMDRAAMAAWLTARAAAWEKPAAAQSGGDAGGRVAAAGGEDDSTPTASEPSNVVPFQRPMPAMPLAGRDGIGNTALARAPILDDVPLPAEYTEDNIAREFAEEEGAEVRWVDELNKWHVWNGNCWQVDKSKRLHARILKKLRRCSQAVALPSSPVAPNQRRAAQQKLGSANMLKNVEMLAKVMMPAMADEFDANPWVLNTLSGVLDLRTGELAEGDDARVHMCTKTTQCEIAPPGTDAPLWNKFLLRACGDDADMVDYLRRVCGYALTGDTSEHSLIFVHGPGGNGKSVFLDTLQGLMGGYARGANVATFTETKNDRHTQEIAVLRGARLVTAQETQEGRRWDESKIKELSGGTRLTAHLMRQDDIEFDPQFKLIIAGNHKPGLRNVDAAMKRRLHLIPFDAEIPLHERDPMLKERLQAEWPAILRWAVVGCMEWQRRRLIEGTGLTKPKAVQRATDEYFEAEDTVKQWLAECTQGCGGIGSKRTDLYKSYVGWMDAAGEKFMAMSQKRWRAALEAAGFTESKQRGFPRYNKLLLNGATPATERDADEALF